MVNEAFTAVWSVVVDGVPMFHASDVRELIGMEDLEVTPVIVVRDDTVKTYQMVSLFALADAVLDKALKNSAADFLHFMMELVDTLEEDSHESDPD